MKSYSVGMQLHMAVKTLAILQGEIVCNLQEVIKKAKCLLEKEGEAKYLLEMISYNLNELKELFERKKNLLNQIKNLERTQKDLIRR